MITSVSYRIQDELREKISPLLYPDENGFPLSLHLIPAGENVLYKIFQLSGADGELNITELTTGGFFREPFRRLSPVGPTEELYNGFLSLRNFVENKLGNIRIFHIGDVKKDVFLTGSTSAGDHLIVAGRMLTCPLHLIQDF